MASARFYFIFLSIFIIVTTSTVSTVLSQEGYGPTCNCPSPTNVAVCGFNRMMYENACKAIEEGVQDCCDNKGFLRPQDGTDHCECENTGRYVSCCGPEVYTSPKAKLS